MFIANKEETRRRAEGRQLTTKVKKILRHAPRANGDVRALCSRTLTEHNGGMPGSPSVPKLPLEDAILAWDAAAVAVLRETDRIASGGAVNQAHLDALRATAEAARQRCVVVSARLWL